MTSWQRRDSLKNGLGACAAKVISIWKIAMHGANILDKRNQKTRLYFPQLHCNSSRLRLLNGTLLGRIGATTNMKNVLVGTPFA